MCSLFLCFSFSIRNGSISVNNIILDDSLILWITRKFSHLLTYHDKSITWQIYNGGWIKIINSTDPQICFEPLYVGVKYTKKYRECIFVINFVLFYFNWPFCVNLSKHRQYFLQCVRIISSLLLIFILLSILNFVWSNF